MADIPASELRGYFAQLPEIESRLNAIEDKLNDTLDVQLTGSKGQDQGLLANRPLANSVDDGFVYYAVDEPIGQRLSYSDGTNWVVM